MMPDFERTFDSAAQAYDMIRPGYPEELYRDIFSRLLPTEASAVLEIGMGSGKASEPFLRTGCRLTGIEPGTQLAALAADNLDSYDNRTIINRTFQEFESRPETFDLIYSATAFHWIEESYGYRRVLELLKSGGVFARFAYHALPDPKRPRLMADIQSLYSEYTPWPPVGKTFGEDNAAALAQLAGAYGFVNTSWHVYHMLRDFTAEEYMILLRTYPDHMSLPAEERQLLFDGIRDAILDSGGIITVDYLYDLELAEKL